MGYRSIHPEPLATYAVAFLFAAGLLAPGVCAAQANEGSRVVPIDKVRLSNRLSRPVKVRLLPDVGDFEIAGGGSEEFACKVITGFTVEDGGSKYRARCGRRYAITQRGDHLELIELALRDDEP